VLISTSKLQFSQSSNIVTDLIFTNFSGIYLDRIGKNSASSAYPSLCIFLLMSKVCVEYWRGLASSLSFPGKTLKKCLDAIHEDIRKVWNFHDPNMVSTVSNSLFHCLIVTHVHAFSCCRVKSSRRECLTSLRTLLTQRVLAQNRPCKTLY